ncbi:MAG: LysR family transcriptional regulator [Sphaerochaetaceae bacterium]|nr:LysR family transcriptional regulator [Sphaerochaetaceae bacterium]
MELRQLKCFYETISSGSMNKAAEKLFTSQPALSIAIKNLESELGQQLFIRNGKKVTPSKYGMAIFPHVEKMIQYEKEIISVCSNIEAERNKIRLSVLAGSAAVSDIVSSFLKEHPEIDLVMQQKDLSQDDTEPDLIIKASRTKPVGENSIVALKERILVAVPKEHELASHTSIDLEELQHYHLISLKKNLALREFEDYHSAQKNIVLKHSIECDNPSILRSIISNGLGVALVAEKTWLFQDQSSVVLIPFNDTRWARYIIIEKTGFRNNDEILKLFIEYTLEYLTKL